MPKRKRRETWVKLAQRHGVSCRTLDRWAGDGIIPPAEYINGRKYGDPDAPPRLDEKRRGAPAHFVNNAAEKSEAI